MSTRRPHVLVVDDDPDLRALIGEALEEEGYRVSGLPAPDLAAVAGAAPDLLLLDYVVGGEAGGGAFLARLRADPATAAIPVVLVTGASPAVRGDDEGWASRGVAVLPKPFDLDALAAVVRSRVGSA